ncbi:MAG: hypothetical protein J0H48_05915 [Nitrosospira multiformis]|nr:hypothetical protein [Nitrosospira multiformis]
MSWAYLVLAGLFEIGWPVGLKMAQEPSSRVTGVAIAVVFMATSGVLLWLAQFHVIHPAAAVNPLTKTPIPVKADGVCCGSYNWIAT